MDAAFRSSRRGFISGGLACAALAAIGLPGLVRARRESVPYCTLTKAHVLSNYVDTDADGDRVAVAWVLPEEQNPEEITSLEFMLCHSETPDGEGIIATLLPGEIRDTLTTRAPLNRCVQLIHKLDDRTTHLLGLPLWYREVGRA